MDNGRSENYPNMYSTDQLAHIIRQKYFPAANDARVNSILENQRID